MARDIAADEGSCVDCQVFAVVDNRLESGVPDQLGKDCILARHVATTASLRMCCNVIP